MDEYPMIDKVTDFIPQTRMVKSLVRAMHNIEQGDYKNAALSLAGITGGTLGDMAKGYNMGQALANKDWSGAARAYGGAVGDLARGLDIGTKLGTATGLVRQGDNRAALKTIHPNLDPERIRKLAGIDAQEPAPITHYDPNGLNEMKKFQDIIIERTPTSFKTAPLMNLHPPLPPKERAMWTARAQKLTQRLQNIYAVLIKMMAPEDQKMMQGVPVSAPMDVDVLAYAHTNVTTLAKNGIEFDVGTFWNMTDSCIAYTLAHEIGHVIQERSGGQFAYKNRQFAYKNRNRPGVTDKQWIQLNRKMEIDADAYGAVLAYKCGYNANEARAFLSRAQLQEPDDPKAEYPSWKSRQTTNAKTIKNYSDQWRSEVEPEMDMHFQQSLQRGPSPEAKEDIQHALHGIEQLNAVLAARPELAQKGPMPPASTLL
jgi:hypothetical protein